VIFHATTVHASGGLMLSGDDLTTMTPDRTALLKKLIPPTGRAAAFADETLGAGRTPLGNGENLYLFNWGDQPAERVVKFRGTRRLTDHWTGKSLGEFTDEYRVPALPGRTAMLIEAMPVK
jgi:alpha-galactosidase